MEIRALELENVKSYAHEMVTFALGTNAICGPNGAGKSTLLEAIGFALFDMPPCRPISNLVREGEKTATITVTVAADDEREYQVVRKCGSSNQYYVYDPELGQKLVDNASDVLAWLREQFGVEEAVDLSALFRDAVGVPQGLLTAPFLQTPKGRQVVFDPLLRVEEYGQAFGKLLDARHALDEQVRAAETLIAGLQAQVDELPGLEGDADALAEAVARAEVALEQLAPELVALEEQKRALEAERDRLRELREAGARLEERAANLAQRAQQAERAVEQARDAQRIVSTTEAAHRAYLAAQKQRQSLEAQEQQRAQTQQATSDCRAQFQLKVDRVDRLEQQLHAAQQAADEATRLRPTAELQERLQQELLQAQLQAQRWQAATARLEQERRRLDSLKARLQQITADLEERGRVEAEVQEAERKAESLAESLATARADEARESTFLEQLQAQEEALAALEAPQCPICESELTPERRADLRERNGEQMGLHREMLSGLRQEIAVLRAESREVNRTLGSLRRQLAQLPRSDEQRTAEKECERQHAAVRQLEQDLIGLAEAGTRAQSLAEQLAELGDARAAYQRALAQCEQRGRLERELAAERRDAAALKERLAGLERDLAAFAKLGDQLAAVRAEMQANEEAHQRYLQHEREAQDLPPRLARLEELQAALRAAEEERAGLVVTLQEAQAAYRPEEYDRVSAAYLRASEERSRLETRLQMQHSQLEEMQARIQSLRAAAARLRMAEDELAELRETGRLLDYVRRVLREAGPQVTKVLVEIISQQAARLYADITNDQTGHLRWTEDYEVLVEHQGHQRSFQQLSGGEQMAAALAVRLALLHEVSGIDLVFFDEPTSNLDETRRDNLADQILGIKFFSQLFVVSHDDTFERATDHIVRLTKEGGVSKVVS